MDGEPAFLALDVEPARRAIRIALGNGGESGLADQELARLRRLLDARRRVDRIADRGEVDIALTPDIADIGDPDVDADAERQPRALGAAVPDAATAFRLKSAPENPGMKNAMTSSPMSLSMVASCFISTAVAMR